MRFAAKWVKRQPNGKSVNGNVATVRKIKDNKPSALTIFFNTFTFQLNTK